MKTTVYPSSEPISYVGDLDLIEANCELYGDSEIAYVRDKTNRYILSQLHTVGTPFYNSTRDNRSIAVNRQYGVRFSYHNYTRQNIIVMDRMNLPVTIFPDKRYNNDIPRIIIRKEMYFDNPQVCLQAYENAQKLGTLCGNELIKIMPLLFKDNSTTTLGRNISIEYTITEQELIDADWRLYHLPTDTLISFNSVDESLKHPCSPEYVRKIGTYLPNYPTEEDDVTLVFRYVNNDPKATPKYIRVANKVFTIKPQMENPAKLVAVTTKNNTSELLEVYSYLECMYPAKVDATRENVRGYRCNRMTLHEAREKHDIYDTLEEALMPMLTAERAEKKLLDKIEILDAENKALHKEHKEKIKELEATIRRKEIEADELKKSNHKEMEAIKEKREEQGHGRKLGFEFVKFLISIVASILALIPLFIKLKAAGI